MEDNHVEQNPYTITFGKEPKLAIPRIQQSSMVLDAFRAADPSNQVFMITGPRGSGKTVFMTEVANRLKGDPDWIVVELNPERDLLESLASKLSSENTLARIFRKAKINLSFFGFGVSIDDVAPITDIESALSKMLESIDRAKRRVLIAIDEVTSTESMRTFAASFQIFLRQDLPVFLLMTGLYENINELQNEKSLTFLYRAPKIALKPLNIGTVSRSYHRTLGISAEDALAMAKLTRGYPYAFQTLGYLAWEHGDAGDAVVDEYRQHLDEYVYDKIWSELSAGDRWLAWGIAQSETGKVSDVRAALGMSTNQFNPYRMRLVRKGIVNGEERGYVRFVLPCFEDYVRENYSA